MSNRLGGRQGTAYLGTNANQPPNMVFNDRPPTQYDCQNYSIGDIWLDSSAPDLQKVWMLVSLEGTALSMGQLAHWIQLSAYTYHPSGIFTWELAVNGANMVAGHGYIMNPGPVAMTLPVAGQYGDVIAMVGYNPDGNIVWTINQNDGQQIAFEGAFSTLGAAGYLQQDPPTAPGSTVELLCVQSDPGALWIVKNFVNDMSVS